MELANVTFSTAEGAASALPFSESVRVGQVLYLSGQVGMDSTQKLVVGGIAAETRQTLENIRRVLERHGLSLDHARQHAFDLLGRAAGMRQRNRADEARQARVEGHALQLLQQQRVTIGVARTGAGVPVRHDAWLAAQRHDLQS